MSSVSKINQLPDELLALIFATGLRDLLSEAHHRLLALICGVCRHWRDVAIGASELWTTIYVPWEGHVPVVQTFLERSKGRLIDLEITELDSVVLAHKVAEITAPHISRARTLRMILPNLNIYNVFTNAYCSFSATNLTSFSIHLTNDIWQLREQPPLFANANSLCHFRTQGDFINVVPSRASLTTLELINYSPTLADIQNIGGRLDHTNEDDATPIIITAPTSLKSLAISLYDSHSNGTSCDCILGSLCIPNLEYLEVVGTIILNINLNIHFRELPKLQTLRIQCCPITLADQFFISLKELRRLELVDMLPELDIRHITGTSQEDPPSSSSPSFPHLSSVFFSTKQEYTESPYQLLQLAERCIAAGCPRFTLEVEKGRSEEFLNAIASCIQDGRVCIRESDCSDGLIKSHGHLFWDLDEEEIEDEEMDDWEPEWEIDDDGWDEEEEDDDAFEFD
ncbi:hypothetical protein ARMSODRAFT_286673 [Armillaria solidipes]|uniref:F-box domain-containing protein n=1 Tax=Armillaria solidipes TaxID=1076256 RepID=A0A2H3C364_9AGAR|nr:hypothetical protein ARMSODRAFT_286673 [Armillaria solidipes]